MRKFLAALAIMGATSMPAVAQTTTPSTTTPATTNQVQPAKPQMIKKRVCEQVDEDSYSRLGNRKICKTVEVPADQPNRNGSGQAPTSSSERGN
jgi:hypothetical protein